MRRIAAMLVMAALTGLVGSTVLDSMIISAPAAAYAGSADLAIEMKSTKVAAGATAKQVQYEVTNFGGDPVEGVTVEFDVSGLDPAKVEVTAPPPNCDLALPILTCRYLYPLREHASISFSFTVSPTSGAGPAGSVTATVSSSGTDSNPANNSTTGQLDIVDTVGADLVIGAKDRRYFRDRPNHYDIAEANVSNQGDQTAVGIRWIITLPVGAKFVIENNGCVFSANRRIATCEEPQITLPPGGGHEARYDSGYAYRVTSTNPDPFVLEATYAVEAMKTVPTVPEESIAAANTLEPDRGDNSTVFYIEVGPYVPDDLPATGGRTGLIAGAGLAVLVVGIGLFAIGRRRTRSRPTVG